MGMDVISSLAAAGAIAENTVVWDKLRQEQNHTSNFGSCTLSGLKAARARALWLVELG